MLCGVIATKQYLSPIKRFIVTQIPLRHIVPFTLIIPITAIAPDVARMLKILVLL